MFDVYVSVAYIGPKSRTERPRNTKIGTEVAHVTRDSDTTFKVQRSKVNLQGAGAYCGGLPHSLLLQQRWRKWWWWRLELCHMWVSFFHDSSQVSMAERGNTWDFYKSATIPAVQSNDRQIWCVIDSRGHCIQPCSVVALCVRVKTRRWLTSALKSTSLNFEMLKKN